MTAVTDQVVHDGTLTIRPLQPTIGAEISGVDLSRPLGAQERDQIKAAILEYKVVFFRDQSLDQDQHAAFARQFGPLYTHPSTTKAAPDKAAAIHKIAATDSKKHEKLLAKQQAEGWDPYHSDTSWRLVPTWGAVLARRSSSSTSPSTRGSSGSTRRRAGSSSRSCMTSTASPSSRSGSAGARARSPSGTIARRCTTRSATTATSPACSSGS